MIPLERAQLHYQPYYCEENIWQLAAAPALTPYPRQVIFISNPQHTCALWGQKAAPPGQPVIWDYHVILAIQAEQTWIYDLDTRWAFPSLAQTYLDQTFLPVPPQFAPYFRVIDAETYRTHLASDRSHMRKNGRWTMPPPPWPNPGQGMNLPQFWDTQTPFLGELMDLPKLRAKLT